MKRQMNLLIVLCAMLITVVVMDQLTDMKLPPRIPHTPLKHKVGDDIWKYFSGSGAVGDFVKKNFGDDVINNIDQIRFDAPGTPEFEIDPHLQFFQPYPVGGGKPYKGSPNSDSGFPKNEVFPESRVVYTFGNKSTWNEESLKSYEKFGVFKEDYPNQDVLAVVTHLRPAACYSGRPERQLKVQPINILPWPQRIENEEDIISGKIGGCMIHPEGWLYYASFVYVAGYKSVLNSRKGNKK